MVTVRAEAVGRLYGTVTGTAVSADADLGGSHRARASPDTRRQSAAGSSWCRTGPSAPRRRDLPPRRPNRGRRPRGSRSRSGRPCTPSRLNGRSYAPTADRRAAGLRRGGPELCLPRVMRHRRVLLADDAGEAGRPPRRRTCPCPTGPPRKREVGVEVSPVWVRGPHKAENGARKPAADHPEISLRTGT